MLRGGGGKEKEGTASFLGTCLIFASPASSLSLSLSGRRRRRDTFIFYAPFLSGREKFPSPTFYGPTRSRGAEKGSETQFFPHMLGKEKPKN